MLDFKALKQASRGLEQASDKRANLSFSHYSKALKMMQRFHQTHDQQILERALNEIQQSLQTHSNQAEPCAVMAYLFYGLESYTESNRYFQRARQSNPDLPLVKKLAELMTAGKPLQQVEVNQEDEAALEKVQRYLHDFAKKITALELCHSVPCLQRSSLQEQYSIFTQLKVESIFLEKDLNYVAGFINISGLQSALESYLKKMRQFEAWIFFSEEALNIYQEIQKRQKSLFQEMQNCVQKEHILLLETHLEEELYTCDAYADYLDAWDEGGYQVTEVILAYEAWVQMIQQVQDFLDENTQ